MRLRLLLLILVAALAGVGAVAAAKAGHARPAQRAWIPALPVRTAPVGDRCPIPQQFRAAFVTAARATGLQLSMLVAVAEVESNFRPRARSVADARGLLQVMPATAASLELDADEPASNVRAGARYLELMLWRYSSTDAALAAYNAGPTAVDRAGGIAPSGETMTYVANVQARWRALAGCR